MIEDGLGPFPEGFSKLLDFGDVGVFCLVYEVVESEACSVDSLASVERMEFLLCDPNFFEFGMFVEKIQDLSLVKIVKAAGVTEQKAPDFESSFVSRNELSSSIDRGMQQSKHMEFIGDEAGLRKHDLGKFFEGVAQIEHDVLHIFSTRDVFESFDHLIGDFRRQKLIFFLIHVIDDERGIRNTSRSAFLKAVFIDTDGFGPGIIDLPF